MSVQKEMKEKLLENLNESQRAAVEYTAGPQLVIAGAGSGKTRVLTYKIAYLLEEGLEPWHILALTFTNKAAQEMKNRIGMLVGSSRSQRLYMGSYHSIFTRILRVEADKLGFTSNFTIYDEADSRSLLKSIIKEMALDDKIYKPSSIHARISMAKNHFILPELYERKGELMERDRRDRMPEISRIYKLYMQRCRAANAMDFDDLLVFTHRLLQENEAVRAQYAELFQYVLVDEYQDTNHVQQCIVSLLTEKHRRICVVGDDAQSIYGFRGANIDNILDFQKLYPEAKLFKLEQNYRSTQNIVLAANSLIKHNQRQIPKDVFSRNDEGEKLTLKPVYSDKEEALVVCKDIKRILRQENGSYNDFAILYRTNSQSRSFEEEMRRQSIPYRIYGGLSFYQRKEIKDIIAYFRLVTNADDEEAIRRIINYPARGIGNPTVSKLMSAAREYEVSCWKILSAPTDYSLDVNKATQNKLTAFRDMIQCFADDLHQQDAFELGRRIIKESGISADLFAGKDPESMARQENLEEFLSGLQEFVEIRREEGEEDSLYLPDFLQEVSLLSDLDSEGDDEHRVALMTVHAAKGLEFPTVFVVGLEENIFPSPRACDSPRELEEERRLLYVAITRAERHCILTCAKNRFRYGRMEFDTPSRFLRDIDSEFLNVENPMGDYDTEPIFTRKSGYNDLHSFSAHRGLTPKIPPYGSSHYLNSRPVATQFMADAKPNLARTSSTSVSSSTVQAPSAASSAPSDYPLAEGNIIEHQRFGVGTVLKIEGTGENTKATVAFKNTGTKQLLLKFARFTVIE